MPKTEKCALCGKNISNPVWIGCECDKWYHTKCVKLEGLKEDDVRKLKNWKCGHCAQGAEPSKAIEDSIKSLHETFAKELKAINQKLDSSFGELRSEIAKISDGLDEQKVKVDKLGKQSKVGHGKHENLDQYGRREIHLC